MGLVLFSSAYQTSAMTCTYTWTQKLLRCTQIANICNICAIYHWNSSPGVHKLTSVITTWVAHQTLLPHSCVPTWIMGSKQRLRKNGGLVGVKVTSLRRCEAPMANLTLDPIILHQSRLIYSSLVRGVCDKYINSCTHTRMSKNRSGN